jgi:hypothetical protein
METMCSLQCLQKPATGLYPQSSRHADIIPWTAVLKLAHLLLGLPDGLFHSEQRQTGKCTGYTLSFALRLEAKVLFVTATSNQTHDYKQNLISFFTQILFGL